MKKVLVLILATLMLFSFGLFACDSAAGVEPVVVTDGVTYTYDEVSDSYKVTAYSGTNAELTILGKIGRKKVSVINKEVFKQNSTLVKVVISEGVEEIGQKAFANCSSLTTVQLPSSLKNLQAYSFSNCLSLVNMSFAGTKDQFKKNFPSRLWHAGSSNLERVTCTDTPVIFSIDIT